MTESRPAAEPAARQPLRTVAAVSLVLVLAGALTTGALAWRANDAVDRVDISARLGGAQPPDDAEPPEFQVAADQVEVLDGALNVLLVGSDDRAVLSEKEREVFGTGEADGERTETIMLLRIDPAVDRIAALSIPRDLLVSRCDGSRGRVNAAYAIGERTGAGGPACLVETVAALTGVEVDHFVKVDFRGFLDIVDTLGGVSLYLEEPLQDAKAFLDLPAGCVTLDSAESLAFVRARGIDSDFGRIARQHRFLRELAAEVSSVGTLANVPRLFSLVETIAGSLEVDEDLSLSKMRRIAATGRDLPTDTLLSFTVPARPYTTNGTEFLALDEDEAQVLFTAFRNGSIVEPPAQRVADADRPEEDPAEDEPDVERDASPDVPDERSPAPIDASRYRGAATPQTEC